MAKKKKVARRPAGSPGRRTSTAAGKKASKRRAPKAGLRAIPVEEGLRDLDPSLQDLVRKLSDGERMDVALTSAGSSDVLEVDVIVRLKDVDAVPDGLKVYSRAGDIVTGTAEVSKVEAIKLHDNVISLKAAARTRPELDESVRDCRADSPSLIRSGTGGSLSGRGVIVGVVDYGCDFAHGNFRHATGRTRLLSLWDQRGGPKRPTSPSPYNYGREYTREAIDRALDADDPYEALGYVPARESHGTHVLDIAAGNGRWTGAPGVAPDADVVFVQVAAWDFGQEENLGNSRRLAEAVHYIFEVAKRERRPCVVNLSLGTHGGPHDGSNLAERFLDNLVEEERGRAVVVAAGNSRTARGHAGGVLEAGESRDLEWRFRVGDDTTNEVEVWYESKSRLEASLVAPNGDAVGPVELGTVVDLETGGNRVGRIIHRESDPNNGDHHVDILLSPVVGSGIWTVRLRNVGAAPTEFHAWVERDDYRTRTQSYFENGDDPSHTLGSIACGEKSIAVASHQPRHPERMISPFSSQGPTRDRRPKPEVSAPGDPIVAASAVTGSMVAMSGTSMAAPHVAGVVALMFEATRGRSSIDETRAAICAGAARWGREWSARYGNGRLDAVGSLRELGSEVEAAEDLRANLAEWWLRHLPRGRFADEVNLPIPVNGNTWPPPPLEATYPLPVYGGTRPPPIYGRVEALPAFRSADPCDPVSYMPRIRSRTSRPVPWSPAWLDGENEHADRGH